MRTGECIWKKLYLKQQSFNYATDVYTLWKIFPAINIFYCRWRLAIIWLLLIIQMANV